MKIKIEITPPKSSEIDRIFATVPVLERFKVLDKAVRAAAKPIVKKAKELAPRSSRSGSALRHAASRFGPRRFNLPLWKTVSAVVRKYDKSTFVAVGPAWPSGNKAFFNSVHIKGYRTVKLWGKNPRNISPQYIPATNWIKQAGDESATEQRAEMFKSLHKSLKDMLP